MSRIASVDGKIGPLEQAVIPVLDRGFLYADGVFETLRIYGGEPFEREAHLARLARSAGVLKITLPLSLAALARELSEAIEAAGEKEAYARIMITRGTSPELALVPPAGLRATRVILVEPVHPPAKEVYARGVSAITLAWGRGDDGVSSSAKLLSYVTSIRAIEEARARGADEAIFVTPDDRVREAAFSNVFVVDAEGNLVTPSEGPGVLGGITRGQVIDIALSIGLSCAIQTVPKLALTQAREVFLTSSVREIVSVVRVDGVAVGGGVPGGTARAIHRALRFRAGATGPVPWE